MATILDASLLFGINRFFVILFIFVVMYAMLQKIGILGKSNNINAIVALALAVFFSVSEGAVQVILIMAPWFAIFLVFLMFLFLVLEFSGFTQKGFVGWMSGSTTKESPTLIFIFAIVILVGAFGVVFGQGFLEEFSGGQTNATTVSGVEKVPTQITEESTAGGDFRRNVGAAVFNARVAGFIMLLLILQFAIRLLTAESL
ncbi:hypothetical protein J4475_02540 [Candidatus Woesearchaeota archaeon]|nr:hypothetical protein [Candidatus Woesearchaeota archaeon]